MEDILKGILAGGVIYIFIALLLVFAPMAIWLHAALISRKLSKTLVLLELIYKGMPTQQVSAASRREDKQTQ